MSKATLEKLPQSEGADYFIVLDPKEGIVHHTYTADLGRSFGHDHIKDAQERDSTTAHRWVVRPVFASPQAHDDKAARMKVAAALDCEGVNFAWTYLTGAIKELVKAERELVQLKSQAQADARNALTDSALLDAMEQQRIAVVPEYEGPWDAEIYNDEGKPNHRGSGSTPREAIRAAIVTQAAQQGGAAC